MRVTLVVIVAMAAALLVGPAGVGPDMVAMRLPRVLAAVVAGAGLALAGVAMQALLRNALADPFILGMSGGASLGAVSTFLVLPVVPPALGGALGALGAVLLVTAIARGPEGLLPGTRLLLSGVAVSSVLGGITEFLLHVASQTRAVRAALYWSAGSLGAARTPTLLVATVTVGVAASLLLARRDALDRLLLGDQTAASLGVDVPRARWMLLGVAAAITGVVVAVGGPIGFVGLAAPHLARLFVGATHRRLLPVAAALGALLLLGADTAARAAFAPRELPTGVLTALLGGPFFLWLLQRRSYGFTEGG